MPEVFSFDTHFFKLVSVLEVCLFVNSALLVQAVWDLTGCVAAVLPSLE